MPDKNNFTSKLLVFALSLGGTCVLLGCSPKDTTMQETGSNKQSSESESPHNSEKVISDASQAGESEESLAIDPYRCIGCGKCVKVAAGNFAMEGEKAVVLSRKVSSQTTQAINICPTKAISA